MIKPQQIKICSNIAPNLTKLLVHVSCQYMEFAIISNSNEISEIIFPIKKPSHPSIGNSAFLLRLSALVPSPCKMNFAQSWTFRIDQSIFSDSEILYGLFVSELIDCCQVKKLYTGGMSNFAKIQSHYYRSLWGRCDLSAFAALKYRYLLQPGMNKNMCLRG